jgi:hypothetical protein
MTTKPLIEFDTNAFHPLRIMEVKHRLMEHPLLQLPKLLELGKRLNARGSVRSHNDQATAGTDFTHAPDTHKPKLSVEETIRHIEQAQAWLALHNVQQDPEYRTLVDEVLDDVRPRVEAKDPGMGYRAGWIFITSPNAVTPYHMDHEHNFILQVHGKKTLNVWDPLDRDVVTERSLELFHTKWSRELVTYKPEYQSRAHVFELEPGMGGYMPLTSPHWVTNGNNVSVTVSFTYYTDLTRRLETLHRCNYALRERGLAPAPVGAGLLRDSAKHAAFRSYTEARRLTRRLLGKNGYDHHLPYAPVAPAS